MTNPPVDFSDIQGIVRFGYGSLTEASFFLLRIREAEAARAWLATAPISTAVECKTAPNTAMQVAFTADGLRALGMSEEVVEGFAADNPSRDITVVVVKTANRPSLFRFRNSASSASLW